MEKKESILIKPVVNIINGCVNLWIEAERNEADEHEHNIRKRKIEEPSKLRIVGVKFACNNKRAREEYVNFL